MPKDHPLSVWRSSLTIFRWIPGQIRKLCCNPSCNNMEIYNGACKVTRNNGVYGANLVNLRGQPLVCMLGYVWWCRDWREEKGLSFHFFVPLPFLRPTPSLPGTPKGIAPSVFFIQALSHPFISCQPPSDPNTPLREKGCMEYLPTYRSWGKWGGRRGLLSPLQPHVTLFWLNLPIRH